MKLSDFVDELILAGEAEGFGPQIIGDRLYRSRVVSIVQDGIAYDATEILIELKNRGWVPTLPMLSPYDKIIIGEFLRLKKSGLHIDEVLRAVADSTKLKILGITRQNINESLRLVIDYFELFGGKYAE